MKQVLVPIADGSEEMEAVITIDVLRRAGARVHVASCMPQKSVCASRDVGLNADSLIDEINEPHWDLIALPGGMPGASHLSEHAKLMGLIKAQISAERWLAAICAAPAVVLGRHHLIKNFRATCYPSFQAELETQCKQVLNEKVVTDRFLITSQGPGTAIPFALSLVKVLYGERKAEDVAKAMVWSLCKA